MIRSATPLRDASSPVSLPAGFDELARAFVAGDIREEDLLTLRTALIRSQTARQQFLSALESESEVVQVLGVHGFCETDTP